MQIYATEYGANIEIDTGIDMTTTTSLVLLIKLYRSLSAPVSKTIPVPAGLKDPATGKVVYTIAQHDFDVPGTYQLQVVDNTGGRYVASALTSITVLPALS